MYICCEHNCYEYLALMLKYIDKNEAVVVNGIPYTNSSKSTDTALVRLVKSQHCDEKWLKLILFTAREKIKGQEVKIKPKIIEKAHQICEKQRKNAKLAQLIMDYVSTKSSKY